jgi:hypothetical protein
VYVALGEPMQKRQFYRAAWIKFREDADMVSVMNELHDKKVEGFKLHVTHLLKPFVNRIRYAPEIASKPDRMAKDLANARALAARLEEEYETLRTAEVPPPGAAAPANEEKKDGKEGAQGEEKKDGEDAAMADAGSAPLDPMPPLEEEVEVPEPGSAAVERRAEKLLADAVANGTVDSSDEKALAQKKVCYDLSQTMSHTEAHLNLFVDSALAGSLSRLPASCVPYVLLLRTDYGPHGGTSAAMHQP